MRGGEEVRREGRRWRRSGEKKVLSHERKKERKQSPSREIGGRRDRTGKREHTPPSHERGWCAFLHDEKFSSVTRKRDGGREGSWQRGRVEDKACESLCATEISFAQEREMRRAKRAKKKWRKRLRLGERERERGQSLPSPYA